MRTIWTVGHSTLPLGRFLQIVGDIDVLADIRRFPGSRRYPHFSRESLEQVKPYRWFEALGGRRSLATDRHPALRNKAFRSYAAHMETPEFAEALGDLEALATAKRTALLCAEGAWFRCHRRLLSDLLQARGWTVLHLPGRRPHVRTPGARLAEGAVVYDLREA
jgi:uncharacterized protein (DUF488 family)